MPSPTHVFVMVFPGLWDQGQQPWELSQGPVYEFCFAFLKPKHMAFLMLFLAELFFQGKGKQ